MLLRKKHLFSIITIINLLFALPIFGQKKVVEILNANELKAGRTRDHQKLVGQVILQYNDTKLYCDSAEVNGKNSDFDAWGKVFINSNNQTKAWGDQLHYDGTTKIGQLSGDVRLKDKNADLKTNLLYFDENNKLVYYLTGAKINSDGAKITSKKGYFQTETKLLNLRDSVVIIHPDYTILADTLVHSSNQKTSFFYGPTSILLSEENIYCEGGFYDNSKKIAEFTKKVVFKKDDNTLKADSLVYFKNTGESFAYDHVSIHDSSEAMIIWGDEAVFNQKTKNSLISGHVLFGQALENDSMFLKSDTLFATEDSLGRKSFRVYHNVFLYKSDMQGKCDSLAYDLSDSLIKLYQQPVIWNGNSQLTGDSISILNYDNKLHELYINQNAFIISKSDSLAEYYDQISGRNMTGYFSDGKLKMIYVVGNGQTIYYGVEEDGSFTGVNKAICSDIKIVFSESKINQIKFITAPEATFYPLMQFPEDQAKLSGFTWRMNEKPESKNALR